LVETNLAKFDLVGLIRVYISIYVCLHILHVVEQL
jgi:hypothetical protein